MTDDHEEGRRPLHARPRALLLVFVGGTIGTAAREAVVLVTPTADVPWGILGVNLVGAFLLGLLVRGLEARRETPRRRDVRLLVGTGVLGGFTTYSALATDSVLLLDAAPVAGVAYALGSVVAGLACAAGGWALAARLWPRHPSIGESAA